VHGGAPDPRAGMRQVRHGRGWQAAVAAVIQPLQCRGDLPGRGAASSARYTGPGSSPLRVHRHRATERTAPERSASSARNTSRGSRSSARCPAAKARTAARAEPSSRGPAPAGSCPDGAASCRAHHNPTTGSRSLIARACSSPAVSRPRPASTSSAHSRPLRSPARPSAASIPAGPSASRARYRSAACCPRRRSRSASMIGTTTVASSAPVRPSVAATAAELTCGTQSSVRTASAAAATGPGVRASLATAASRTRPSRHIDPATAAIPLSSPASRHRQPVTRPSRNRQPVTRPGGDRAQNGRRADSSSRSHPRPSSPANRVITRAAVSGSAPFTASASDSARPRPLHPSSAHRARHRHLRSSGLRS
jgi:hypothetical protein